jgi:hypothetical protein
MLAFAALDTSEVFHQIQSDESGLAVVALAVAASHLAAAALACVMAWHGRDAVAAPAGTPAA